MAVLSDRRLMGQSGLQGRSVEVRWGSGESGGGLVGPVECLATPALEWSWVNTASALLALLALLVAVSPNLCNFTI